jgi:DNA-binding GntR family transcriptional regulator
MLHACRKNDAERAVKILQQYLGRASERLVAFLSGPADHGVKGVKS